MPSAQSSTYRLSFTSGGLYSSQAIKAAEIYRKLGDWDQVAARLESENILQARTASSLKRMLRELMARLKTMTSMQLDILIDGTRQEQNQILWVAACKHYPFIREFAVNVVREKYLRLDWELTSVDFSAFYNAKAEWDEKLERITESSRIELRRVIYRMLREVEILSTANLILPPIITQAVARAIRQDDLALFMIFPISDVDIRKLSL